MGERHAGAQILVEEMCRSKARKQVAKEKEHAEQNKFLLKFSFFVEKNGSKRDDNSEGRKESGGIVAGHLHDSRIGE